MERLYLRDAARVKAVGRILKAAVDRARDREVVDAPAAFADLRGLSLTRAYEAVARMLGWDNHGRMARTTAGWRGAWSVSDEDLPASAADLRHAEQGAALRRALVDLCGHDFGAANCAAAARAWHVAGRQPPFDPPGPSLAGHAAWLAEVEEEHPEARWPLRFFTRTVAEKYEAVGTASIAEHVATLRRYVRWARDCAAAGCSLLSDHGHIQVSTSDMDAAVRLGLHPTDGDDSVLGDLGFGKAGGRDPLDPGPRPPADPAAPDEGAWFDWRPTKGWLSGARTLEEMADTCERDADEAEAWMRAGVRVAPNRNRDAAIVFWTRDPEVAAEFGFGPSDGIDDEDEVFESVDEDDPYGILGTEDGANTLVSWRYRDADNYKSSGEAVLAGRLTRAERLEILGALDAGVYFVPGQVGLDDLQGRLTAYDGWKGEADHPWHELYGIEGTDRRPTAPLTAAALLEAFRTVAWDEDHAPSAAPPCP